MDLSGSSDRESAWLRTISAVAAAATAEDALEALLVGLAPVVGASAAAITAPDPPRVWATWGCQPAEILALLERTPLRAHGGEHDEAPVVEFDSELAAPSQSVLILGLQPGGELHHLLLFLTDDAGRAKSNRQAGVALAGLAKLLLEREQISEEARQAEQARDHFLVAMHHELRTPATALMLEAGLLRSGVLGELSPRLDGSLARLEGHVEELVRVVRRVLDLAALETAAEPGGGNLVDPRETVTALARRVEPSARRKGVALALYFPKSLPLLQTDAERFRRVLLCLLANALKYTDSGTIQIRVERGSRTAGAIRREPLLLFKVLDTGCGIPPAELDRVFEPFAQVEEGARTDSGARGVGLGLPLARKLARSLAGDVSIESTAGKGTTATFSIPCRPAEVP